MTSLRQLINARAGGIVPYVDTTWTISDLHDELDRFERAARSAGLAENSVRTYVDRSRTFLRWLDGDFQFQGGR